MGISFLNYCFSIYLSVYLFISLSLFLASYCMLCLLGHSDSEVIRNVSMKFNWNSLGYWRRFSLGCVGDYKRKGEHQRTLRLLLPQTTTKGGWNGVLEVPSSSSAQIRIIINTTSSQWWLCLSKSWKLLSIGIPQHLWAPIAVLHRHDHRITWIKQSRSLFCRGDGCFGYRSDVGAPGIAFSLIDTWHRTVPQCLELKSLWQNPCQSKVWAWAWRCQCVSPGSCPHMPA